jgi:hypothetical protein
MNVINLLEQPDDFEHEVEQLRNSVAFQSFLDERSAQGKKRIPLEDVIREIEAELVCQSDE